MSIEIPISDEALQALQAAIEDGTIEAAIRAFLEAEGFTEQRTNVVSDTLTIKRRLVGPWHEVD